MDRTGFQRWLDAYVEAWKSYDEGSIGDLFTDDAEYSYHPWDEPVRGREAIVASWLDNADTPGVYDARYEPLLLAEDGGVAAGRSLYYADSSRSTLEREYHNVFLVRFDEAGRCREFREWYMLRDHSQPSE